MSIKKKSTSIKMTEAKWGGLMSALWFVCLITFCIIFVIGQIPASSDAAGLITSYSECLYILLFFITLLILNKGYRWNVQKLTLSIYAIITIVVLTGIQWLYPSTDIIKTNPIMFNIIRISVSPIILFLGFIGYNQFS